MGASACSKHVACSHAMTDMYAAQQNILHAMTDLYNFTTARNKMHMILSVGIHRTAAHVTPVFYH